MLGRPPTREKPKREWLKNLRESHGLTQSEMAKIIGYKPDSYWRIEAGDRNTRNGMKSDVIFKLAEYFGIDPAVLLKAENEFLKELKAYSN